MAERAPAVGEHRPWLIVILVILVGGAATYLVALPAIWRLSCAYGLLFGTLGAIELGSAAAAF